MKHISTALPVFCSLPGFGDPKARGCILHPVSTALPRPTGPHPAHPTGLTLRWPAMTAALSRCARHTTALTFHSQANGLQPLEPHFMHMARLAAIQAGACIRSRANAHIRSRSHKQWQSQPRAFEVAFKRNLCRSRVHLQSQLHCIHCRHPHMP